MPSLIPEDLTQAGTHALVIGVSRYRHFEDGDEPTASGAEFGMEQLSAAARSASQFAAWLLNEYRCKRAPLRSLRVLLSPSDGEVISPAIAALLNGDTSARLENVRVALKDFRHACDTHVENVAIVYVAGQGVQLTKHGAILLLTDFGAPGQLARLEGAVDMAGIHAGMNHPTTARTQFWFVDACRQRPAIARRFETLEGALKLDVPNGDTETSPMFLAATTGKAAYARVGGVTLFNEALMWSLRGGAASGPEDEGVDCWHVPVTALIKRLPDRVKALALGEQAEQSVDIAGKIHEAAVHEFAAAPHVDVNIDVDPAPARHACRATLRQSEEAVVVENYTAWPLQRPVEAGLYALNIAADAPYKSYNELLFVRPPAMTRQVKVAP